MRVPAAQYRGTALAAFQSVAETLHVVTTDDRALAAAIVPEAAAQVTREPTLEQKRFGFVNELVLLAAEQAYQQALNTRIQAEAPRWVIRPCSFKREAAAGGIAKMPPTTPVFTTL
jgi:outer membrane protein TolC